jgi:hypothetical protein
MSAGRRAAARAFELSGLETVLGPPSALRAQRQEKKHRDEPLKRVLETIAVRCGDSLPSAPEQPLFMLSAGWRSGSTLLQRLINSSGDYLLWGEPYARSEPIARLADSLRPISAEWPPAGDVMAAKEGWEPADGWTANLHPPLTALVESHREHLRTLFEPVPDAGKSRRWGFKEVRLSGEYALYLRFLFPAARFLFLVRDPTDAFASYKAWRSWYRRWPDEQVRTAGAYASMWSDLAASFLETHEEVGALLLRYEDLVPGNAALDRLDDFLGSPVDRSVLERRISGRQSRPLGLTKFERLAMRRRLGKVPSRLGYAKR